MSLLQELQLEINNLVTSDPVFSIRKNTGGWQGTSLTFKPVSKVGYPHNPALLQTNPLQALVRKNHSEHFDGSRKCFVIDVDAIRQRVRGEVKSYILDLARQQFRHENLILLKWYETYALSEHNLEKVYFETFLGIYKYMMLHLKDPDVEKHITNAGALLDLIFQRDYKEMHIPQPRRRRRRRK